MGTYFALYASDMTGPGEEWTLVSPAPTRMEIEWNHTDESSRMIFTLPSKDRAVDPPVWPYQKVCLVRMDTKPPLTRASIGEAPIFYGRVNDVRPVMDTSAGRRTWELTIRDFMQSLADNYVRPAQWNPVGRAAWDPSGLLFIHDYPDYGDWIPDYVERGGEYRERIIREVVANCLPESTRNVDTTDADRVAPMIVNNYMYLGELRIMDMVADIAKEHPWDASDPPRGMGHFFRQAHGHPPDANPISGNLADATFLYARRDKYMWEPDGATTLFAQGRGALPQLGTGFTVDLPWPFSDIQIPAVIDPTRVVRVIDYDFPTAGHDIFSRAYVYGRGDNVHTDGTVDTDMESEWDPEHGRYAVHREAIEYDESISDSFAKGLSQAKLREHGLLFNKPRLLRGPKEGWIEVAGLPFSRAVGQLYQDIGPVPPLPGYVLRVWVQDAGMSVAEAYFVERLVWKIPENKTRIYLNRRGFKNLDRVLVGQGIKGKMNTTGVKDFWNTGWQPVATGGNTFTHNLGVMPHRVDVYATVMIEGVPNLATVAKVPYGGYDPVQGQYYGFMITNISDKVVTIITAPWLAYSASAGRWLHRTKALITIVATPL